MWGDAAIGVMAIAYHEILLFAAIGLLIGGIDDFIVDMLFLCRSGWRRMTVYTRHPRMTTADLPPSPSPGRIAIFVPAWREADVIGAMLRHALSAWGEADYCLFVGAYPNDRDTIDAITLVAAGQPRILMAINHRDGPTTKADCLNTLWRAMLSEEQRTGRAFKAVVLHDAEDVVHADEIRIFDLLIDRFALIQLPVLPLPGTGGWWGRAIAGHYGDEFAEAHGKSLVVREALGASMPSAGVACAFSRPALDRLIDTHHGGPFDPGSLTEDYEAGLRTRALGGQGIFVRIRDAKGDLVATREHFPERLDAAVRQKARWMIGIALAGWDRMGWRGGPAEAWMRMRDRRVVISTVVLLAAYAALLLWAALTLMALFLSVPLLPLSPVMTALLWLNAALMAWRIGIRCVFVGRAYGWRQGIAAVPRTLVANMISILAARRAMRLYIKSLFGTPLVWDKTHHHFPDMPPIS